MEYAVTPKSEYLFYFLMNIDESLESQFFIVVDDFGRLSSVDSSILGSSEHNWMPDNASHQCIMCKKRFSFFSRRHHCRNCELLYCGDCTSSVAYFDDKNVRICDACSVTNYLLNAKENAYPGLQLWASSSIGLDFFRKSPKSTGIVFFCSLLTGEMIDSHRHAINTLLKLYKTHAPLMIASGAAKYLLLHSINCKCPAAALTLDLFVTLYNADPHGCKVDVLSAPYNTLDVNQLLKSDDTMMMRATARFLHLMVYHKRFQIGLIESLSEKILYPDNWVSAFIVASISTYIPSFEIFDIDTYNADLSKRIPNGLEIIPSLIKVFDPKEKFSSVASIYYSLLVLEYMAHFDEEAVEISKRNLSLVFDVLNAYIPHSCDDDRPECKFAVLISSIVVRVLRRLETIGGPEDLIVPIFSSVLAPISEIIQIENPSEGKSYLFLVQLFSIEMLAILSHNTELRSAIKSEQMMTILNKIAIRDDSIGKQARIAIDSLNSTQ